MKKPEKLRFTLEFTSLDEFAAFVSVIRGEAFGDDATIRELTAKLKKSTDAELAAVNAATKDK